MDIHSDICEGATLDKDIIAGAASGLRDRGRARRRWIHDIEDWTWLKISSAWKRAGDIRQRIGTGSSCHRPRPLRGMAHDMTCPWYHRHDTNSGQENTGCQGCPWLNYTVFVVEIHRIRRHLEYAIGGCCYDYRLSPTLSWWSASTLPVSSCTTDEIRFTANCSQSSGYARRPASEYRTNALSW